MISLPPVRGVIFDLDGTLYDMSWYLRPLFFLRLFRSGMRLTRFFHIRETFAGKDLGSQQALIDALSAEVSRQEGSDRDEIRSWIQGPFYATFVAIMPFFRHSRPGIVPMLASLREKGVRLGVLSDYDRVKERLEKLSIPPSLFDTIASSEAAGALKPNSRPYAAIAVQWGIEPGSVLVVGDREDTDGAAAADSGMRFVLVKNGRQSRTAGKGYRWKELKDLLVHLDKE
jgi:FMN phosphatase YigB (HAD superfamily)